jgi:cytoskeletal protein CcmA (bactofilin family)
VSDLELNEKHPDEITLLLYVERQLERDAAQEVSRHTQTCTRCMTLLRALDREARLLTRSMLEQDEPLPARLAQFPGNVKHSLQWIWGVVFGLAVMGVYALYSGYIEPWQQRFADAGFGSSNLVSLLVFQGAFWKGWQSMVTLVEVVAFACAAGFGLFAVRRYLRRGAALAVVFASLGLVAALATPASATEFRKEKTLEVKKDEVIHSDLFAMADHLRIDGTIDGDLFAFTEQGEIAGHITGDVMCFCQGLRVSGQVDGNIRSLDNNITITGSVGRSVTNFSELFTLDPSGKIGYSLTTFGKSLTLDGHLGRDLLAFSGESEIDGTVGGSMRVKGESLDVGGHASIAGPARFEGDHQPSVASGAQFASPLQYTKWEHRNSTERGVGYYVWRLIWIAAFILFGVVLLSVMPLFSREAAQNVENVGASFGLGVLVFPAVPMAAIVACVTVVGLLVGMASLFLWIFGLFISQIVVGTAIGQWILGRAHETFGLIGRMAVGVLLLRICMLIPYIGGWLKLAIMVWGMGAIALAIYRRVQPTIAPNIPSAPLPPVAAPLPPNTTVGGVSA